MKKLKSTFGNMVIVLGCISCISAAVLAYVNKVTVDAIAAVNQKILNDGIKQVVGSNKAVISNIDTLKNGCIVYRTNKGCAVVSVTNGFGGDLKVLVGFDQMGNIKGYRILETHETPGLGIKAGNWFQKSGHGDIIGKNPGNKELSVKKDGGEIDAITASTITSRAFLKAVNDAYKAYRNGDSDDRSGATEQHVVNNK
jgi:Na+-translocating ferredoxin:NAD+ oxidoreductase subunit G